MNESLLKRGQKRGFLAFRLVNVRDFTFDKHKTADDKPFGGGAGMVLKAEPIIRALDSLKIKKNKKSKVVLLTPQGRTFNQAKAQNLARCDHLVFICGHYEGVDERIKDFADEEISIGDYILMGGEAAALVVVEAVCRGVKGVVKELSSVAQDSFSENLLDYPCYTRPAEINCKKKKLKVPSDLISGHHEQIARWRRKKMIEKTFFERPDLLPDALFNKEDQAHLKSVILGN